MSKWIMMRLDECTQIVSGATPSTSEPSYWDGDICWATPKDLSELQNPYITDTPRKITHRGLESCAAVVLPPESVLFSSRAPIGHVAINTVPMATNQGFKSLIPNRNQVHAKFLYHWLRKNRPYLESLGNGATFKEVSKAVVSRIEIPLPPLPEQHRIAEILDKADALRAKRRAALAQLDALAQAIFLDMFGDPATNPKGWPKVTLGAHTSKIGSGATPLGGETAYKNSGIALIRSMNVRDGVFLRDNLAYIDTDQAARLDGVAVEANDVLLNITGASVARVCRAPVEVLPARVNQHVTIIRPTEGFNALFLETCLLFPSMKRQLLKIAGAGATREAITKAAIEQFKIIQPPIDEQSRFAAVMNARERTGRQQQQALAELDALFASLQHRAFRGEL